jgi:hypothetical protein
MDDVTIPGEPVPTASPLIRRLTVVASGLTVASIVVNLILQVAHFLKKKPMQPDQRDRLETAGIALSIMKQMPGLIKQARLFLAQIRNEPTNW